MISCCPCHSESETILYVSGPGGGGAAGASGFVVGGGAGGGAGFFWYGKKKARLVMAANRERFSSTKALASIFLVFN